LLSRQQNAWFSVINGIQTTIAGARFAPIEPLSWGPFINSGNNVLIINASATYHQTRYSSSN
jgi:hypothetical protein